MRNAKRNETQRNQRRIRCAHPLPLWRHSTQSRLSEFARTSQQQQRRLATARKRGKILIGKLENETNAKRVCTLMSEPKPIYGIFLLRSQQTQKKTRVFHRRTHWSKSWNRELLETRSRALQGRQTVHCERSVFWRLWLGLRLRLGTTTRSVRASMNRTELLSH